MKSKTYFGRFLISALISAMICASSSKGWSASAPAAPPAVVFGKQAAIEEIHDELTYPARVVPKINTTVLAESDGVVSRIPTLLGQRVGLHETLMVLTHTDPVYQYAPMKVLSPIAGVISSIDVSEGTQVTKGQKLGSVTDPKRLRVVIEVPAEDLDSLKKGLPGEFKIAGRPEPVPVKLLGVSPFVDPATGTATCEFEPERKKDVDASLAPGIVGRVVLKVHERHGIRVPEFAVIYRNQAPYARIYEAGKIRFSPVQLGRKQEGLVEILSGVKPGETVVVRSSRFVAEGEAVQLDDGKSGPSP